MERAVALRGIFSYMEDAERLGMFVRCPLHGKPSEIFDCVTCTHYQGLQTRDRELFQLRCSAPELPPRDQVSPPGSAYRSLSSVSQPAWSAAQRRSDR